MLSIVKFATLSQDDGLLYGRSWNKVLPLTCSDEHFTFLYYSLSTPSIVYSALSNHGVADRAVPKNNAFLLESAYGYEGDVERLPYSRLQYFVRRTF